MLIRVHRLTVVFGLFNLFTDWAAAEGKGEKLVENQGLQPHPHHEHFTLLTKLSQYFEFQFFKWLRVLLRPFSSFSLLRILAENRYEGAE